MTSKPLHRDAFASGEARALSAIAEEQLADAAPGRMSSSSSTATSPAYSALLSVLPRDERMQITFHPDANVAAIAAKRLRLDSKLATRFVERIRDYYSPSADKGAEAIGDAAQVISSARQHQREAE